MITGESTITVLWEPPFWWQTQAGCYWSHWLKAAWPSHNIEDKHLTIKFGRKRPL